MIAMRSGSNWSSPSGDLTFKTRLAWMKSADDGWSVMGNPGDRMGQNINQLSKSAGNAINHCGKSKELSPFVQPVRHKIVPPSQTRRNLQSNFK
ncbi:hypothetical protein [Agrobacterium rosae]|uniref:Bacterial mobilisation domain-containing protein n=1 Tax=Agrobacterium rosae TaxID=1972867 RepID=A0AAW9FKC6_9HYPH|nr:hypothetical protein [Agrobacterium rosae]MDX8305940.1 hypothetical protein [Agrobacterium rosae]